MLGEDIRRHPPPLPPPSQDYPDSARNGNDQGQDCEVRPQRPPSSLRMIVHFWEGAVRGGSDVCGVDRDGPVRGPNLAPGSAASCQDCLDDTLIGKAVLDM